MEEDIFGDTTSGQNIAIHGGIWRIGVLRPTPSLPPLDFVIDVVTLDTYG